jgi:hypothetical protein
MTYGQYSKVEATDFNNLSGSPGSNTPNTLNAIMNVGSGNRGYGQSGIVQVPAGGRVNASNWSTLFSNLTAAANHQNTSITSTPTVSQGSRLNYVSTVSTDITSCYDNALNALAQGTTTTNNADRTQSWANAVTTVHTITFSSGDAARYFFNAGGQISIIPSVSGGSTALSALFSSLATACGTIYLSSPASGTARIAGTTYNGITKINGSGTPSVLSSNSGYYALGATDTEVFRQAATGQTPSGYAGSYISVSIRTNGTQGLNGDKGNIIYITTVFDEVPNNFLVDGLTRVSCTIRPPSIAYLQNSWGTPTITSTTSGS